ncbi:dihydroxyacetone kinase phosphoryl donor subunit DhaM [Thermoflavimicrobium daqui]|jgi:dihydroxyacetone kinase phosphotransfer subunit|uniref:phosphoenolpyruvate--glycerone phosphotransferase n=1 Tax=Thermoflavimicrobium daqui TaxID=2137476 RepID=A0A364K4J0_9BACL|nr:dihydroxyacetone kinase phosphoryl donor subunit DhaM [Thermoflavimicrobium daqui]RAL24282.1 dihydroxyacetone kinase [Thermoflavimicrobium daqui]
MNMVGIVLVSHSYELVHGLQQMLIQIQRDVPIAIAGGDEDGGLGTSALKIKNAVEEVYSDKGVVILFDLGSAFLNTELALEWIDKDKKVRIANAPLVEGAYGAVVQSGCGGTVEEVLRAAERAKQLNKVPSL